MEDGVVVVAGLDVGEEVGRLGRLLGVEFEGDDAVVGGELDHGVSCGGFSFPAALDRFDEDRRGRDVPVGPALRSAPGDFLDHVEPLRDLAEHGITPVRRGMVKEAVVNEVDEELRGGRIRIAGARHGDGAGSFFRPFLASLGSAAGLLLHVGGEAAALDHEARNHAMEQGAVEETVLGILEEILYRFRRLVGIQLEGQVPCEVLTSILGVGGMRGEG
jgi:hypothetical protein